jgi:acetyltransferase-like isoleucine patch superfamily enzyme
VTAAKHLSHDWFPRPLPANIIIGENSWVYSSFAFLHYCSRRSIGVRIGSQSGIYNGTFFNMGPDAQVEIGNFCAIVGAIFSCNTRVVVGDYTFIAHEVVIADQQIAVPPHDGPRTSTSVEGDGPASILIGANAWIGIRAVLLAGAQIGEGSIVGAAAVVDFAVPPYSVVAGNPARVVARITR